MPAWTGMRPEKHGGGSEGTGPSGKGGSPFSQCWNPRPLRHYCRAMIKPQWFVRMKEMAQAAIDTLKEGNLTFVPERFDKTYLHWLENIRDWCISRQLWWGHRIPAYYCDECGETVVAREMPQKCPKCGCTHFHQDEDTLDTWFSSALCLSLPLAGRTKLRRWSTSIRQMCWLPVMTLFSSG